MKKPQLNQLITAAAVAFSLSQAAISADLQVPRGADVASLAGNCNIGSFPQTGKAGMYNELCHIMQDNEKCLALIKRHFHFTGEVVRVAPFQSEDVERGRYCLDVLKHDLGL